MMHLLRTTIIPWIAALTVSLTSVALGAESNQPQLRKKVRKVIVIQKNPTAAQPGRDTVVDPHRSQGYWQPGGYEGRIGSPYYYSVPGAHYGYVTRGSGHHHGDRTGCGCADGRRRRSGHAHGHYGNRAGSYHSSHGGFVTDPYTYHFGPGHYRRYEHGHHRFPYYSYRRPWYYPGQPVFNRDTNFAW